MHATAPRRSQYNILCLFLKLHDISLIIFKYTIISSHNLQLTGMWIYYTNISDLKKKQIRIFTSKDSQPFAMEYFKMDKYS